MDVSLLSMTLILLILIFLILVLWYFYVNYHKNNNNNVLDFASVNEIFKNNAHNHRLLMIEIIGSRPIINNFENVDKQIIQQSITESSDMVTFNKMQTELNKLYTFLNPIFGNTTTNKIITLLQKRNEILRDYYNCMTDVICNINHCFHSKITKDGDSVYLPGSIPHGSVDITIIAQKNLENISREIIDTIASSFHIRDTDISSNKNIPADNYQRLLNLFITIDKELINQAKSYASRHYDISINCSNTTIELSTHITDEFYTIIYKYRNLML